MAGPALLAAAAQAALGTFVVSDAAKALDSTFRSGGGDAAKGAMLFDGMELLKGAAVLAAAARFADTPRNRAELNVCVAVTQMADAAVTLHQKRHHGLAAAHADASMAISVATAGLAAICAAREWNKKGGGGVGGAAAQHKE